MLRSEAEMCLGRFADEDFWKLDVAKISTFNSYIRKWKKLNEEHPDEVIIVREDDFHISFKIHKDLLKIGFRYHRKGNPQFLNKKTIS